jgi:hypothetical protein
MARVARAFCEVDDAVRICSLGREKDARYQICPILGTNIIDLERPTSEILQRIPNSHGILFITVVDERRLWHRMK